MSLQLLPAACVSQVAALLTRSLPAANAHSRYAAPAAAGPEPPSLDEELALLKYYASKLQHACREVRGEGCTSGCHHLGPLPQCCCWADLGPHLEPAAAHQLQLCGQLVAACLVSPSASNQLPCTLFPSLLHDPPVVQLRLPRRVLGTALSYLKRIYVSHSCLEHDPQQLLLTCLYLACKVSALAHAWVWRKGSAGTQVAARLQAMSLVAVKRWLAARLGPLPHTSLASHAAGTVVLVVCCPPCLPD